MSSRRKCTQTKFSEWRSLKISPLRFSAISACLSGMSVMRLWGERLEEAVKTIATGEAPLWELFQEYNPRNATKKFTELEWE